MCLLEDGEARRKHPPSLLPACPSGAHSFLLGLRPASPSDPPSFVGKPSLSSRCWDLNSGLHDCRARDPNC